MADKRISQLIERVDIANNDVLPIVASGATTTNKVTISTIQDWMQSNLDVGVTSVGLTMPSAFQVSGSPITTSGNITVTATGTASQYIRGDGTLADFPTGGGGGGASVSYYLNGSVSQGTIGGVSYLEMNKTPVLGAGTDFTINANGYIASFITDAGDPGLLEIPGGNWNFETYFQASSGGGTPSFYIELYKVSGSTATLIASNSANPELIAFGTTTTAYFSSLAVPTTTLALTDRLALRYYVTHSGRTITLHTENSNLCQIITTFTTGLTALNGLTTQVQNFATGTSGTDFAISSTSATHTFNLPDASATARGVVTTGSQTIAGIKTFTSNMNADGGVRLPATGTALPTFVNNISGSGLSSSGSNGFGFNNANNFYFSGSDKGGSVFVVNNTATRNYTFQDTSGVIALTSNIPTNPVGGSGTINQIPKYTSSTTTIGNSNISDNGSDVVIASRTGISLSGQSILITPNLGGTTNRIETTGGLPLALVTSGSSITLAAGGTTPQITLGSNGNVSIGDTTTTTASGYQWLRVNGSTGGVIELTSSSSRVLQIQSNGTSAGAKIQTVSSSPLILGTDGTDRLTISSTGAATFSSSVTANKLISAADANSGSIEFGTSSLKGILSYSAGTGLYLFNNQTATAGTTVPYFQFQADSSPIMTMLKNGNVGIGTASPAARLHVNNGTNLNVAFNTTTVDSVTTSRISSFNDAVSASVGLVLNGTPLVFTTSDTERMRITSGGVLRVGTSSFDSGGAVSGDIAVGANSQKIGYIPSSTSNRGYFEPYDGSGFVNIVSTFATAGIRFMTGISATERMRISSNGGVQSTPAVGFNAFNAVVSGTSIAYLSNLASTNDVSGYWQVAGNFAGSISHPTSTTTNYNVTSDYRLKENIMPLENGLDAILKLKPITANYINDENKINIPMFLAHEVQEVIPIAVTGEKDAMKIDKITGEETIDIQQLDASKIIPHMVKAIQELKAEIEALKSQING